MRVRVTTLESFRVLLTEEYGSEEELIESIRRGQEAPPANWKMACGTAFHAILADPHALDTTDEPEFRIREGDYSFQAGDVDAAKVHVGPGVCEVPGSLLVGDVLLTGTCDRMQGLTIRDAKCKFTTPDARDYEHSLQWRAYLLIFGAEQFLYDLFAFSEPDEVGFCRLREIVTFGFWRYPDMEADVLGWLTAFVRWAESRGLTQYLETAGRKAA